MASDSTAGGAPADMPADADPTAQTGTPSLAELMRTIEQLQADKADMQDKYLRAAAESQNIRRRAQQDVEKERKFGIERFGRDVLSVADNLGRALASLSEEQRADEAIKPLLTGLEATERELMSVFERHGITRIAAIGLPLDPNQHQAMLEIPSDKDAGTIVQEMQAGYMMKDRLLRPAMVGVAKKAD